MSRTYYVVDMMQRNTWVLIERKEFKTWKEGRAAFDAMPPPSEDTSIFFARFDGTTLDCK